MISNSVVLLNKMDLVSKDDINKIKRAVNVLNPNAIITTTEHSKIKMNKVVRTGKFNMEEAEQSPGWLKSLQEEMVPETEEYGISSFVYRSR
jgi:G3E family GTPase